MHAEDNGLREINGSQLSRLYTFEVAARCASFSVAAAELALTPSAVSHRISQLENELNIRLFNRSHRKVELTLEGERIYAAMNTSLNFLNQEVQSIKNQGFSGRLTVYCRPSFAQSWLSPGVASFLEAYPQIDLVILTGNEEIDLHRMGVDLSISFDDAVAGSFHQEHLMDETIVPVCSPEYAQRFELIDQPHNLSSCRLLHDRKAWSMNSGGGEWLLWAQHYAIDITAARGTEFDQAELAVTAAVHHAGVAIGRKRLIGEKLRSGELIMPFPNTELQCAQHYYISTHADRRWPKVEAFIGWLKARAAADR
ncbi:DNA-binding transcriptional regulator DsdC [Candidatus Pantoea formicae]|uniref:DNA-binding transcriptional regulator DsdC n=1 Tax=Candidatus Pantoea formicae TaxID=2608355 RepID=UPI003ED98A65